MSSGTGVEIVECQWDMDTRILVGYGKSSGMGSGKVWSKLLAWIRQQFGQSFVNKFRQELEHWSRSKIWAQGFGNWNISRI